MNSFIAGVEQHIRSLAALLFKAYTPKNSFSHVESNLLISNLHFPPDKR